MIAQPRKTLLSLSAVESAAEKTSEEFELHPAATQWALFWRMDQAGTIDVDFYGPDGAWHEFATQAVAANTPGVLAFTVNHGRTRVRFTPGGQPVTGFIVASYAGHAGGLA